MNGIFDTEFPGRKIIVAGSARLDCYRKGGDSLAGRYRYFRLHPFSLGENSNAPTADDLQQLLRFGGFPEPLFSANAVEHRIWQREHLTRVAREDLRDLEQVREISLLEHLVELLPARVGSPLSIKGLRENPQADHKTVERWLSIFENLYVSFRISPYGSAGGRLRRPERGRACLRRGVQVIRARHQPGHPLHVGTHADTEVLTGSPRACALRAGHRHRHAVPGILH